MKRRFENRAVLVTGAGTGMGRAVALQLAREGASATLRGRREEPLEAVAENLREVAGSALVQTCDIADRHEIAANLKVGLTEREIAETISQRALDGGLPAAINALNALRAICRREKRSNPPLGSAALVRGPFLL